MLYSYLNSVHSSVYVSTNPVRDYNTDHRLGQVTPGASCQFIVGVICNETENSLSCFTGGYHLY